MKIRKIFVDAHQFDHGFDGAASFIQGLYLALVRRNPSEYKIYLGCANPERVMASFEDNAHFEPIKYRTENRYRRLAVDIPLAISKCGAHVAHFQYFTPLLKTCPWIVTIHDVLFNDFPQYFPSGYAKLRNLLFPISARRADLLTTVSDYSRERIAHWYGVKPQRIAVIPNGVSHFDISCQIASDQNVKNILSFKEGYFLCVSRFEPRKNQSTLLTAYIEGGFWLHGIQLVFVGGRTLSGGDFDNLVSTAPIEVRQRLHFLEGLSFTDIQLLYANAAIAIYPSFAEGFGMPPLEAAAAGTPSLCSGTTAMAGFDCLASNFFNPNDSNELQSLLTHVVENQSAARSNAASVQPGVLSQYSWDRAASLLEAQLSRIPGFT